MTLQQLCLRSVLLQWQFAIVVLCALFTAQAHAGESPVSLEITQGPSLPTVGEPLIVEIQVTNTSNESLPYVSVSVDGFKKTWYFDLVVEGCEIGIEVSDPDPSVGGGPHFGFRWQISNLGPGETADCLVSFPQTLSSGTESVEHHVYALSEFWERGSFTYTLVPVHSEVPVEVKANVEGSPQTVGEPLVIDLQARNISGEVLPPFVIDTEQLIHLPGLEAFSADGCDIDVFTNTNSPPPFALRWYVPELQPNETTHCRLTFPDTQTPGTETISFLAWVQGTAWENLGEVTYTMHTDAHHVPVGGAIWAVLAILLVLLAARWRLHWRDV